MFRQVVGALFGSGLVLATTANLVASQEITIRAEHDETSISNTHKVLQEMAQELSEKSDGRIRLEVHSGASLSGGKIPTMIQNVQLGNVDASWIASGIYAANDYRWAVLSLPFMFGGIDDLEEIRRSGVMSDLMADQRERNLEVLDLWVRPLRQIINAEREIRTPEDAAGLRFRVPEIKMWEEAFQAMGATPVPLPFSEIPTAMELGTIQGAERPTDYLVSEQWWDMAEYVSLVDYTGDVVMVSFNVDFWNGLDSETQSLLRETINQYGTKKYEIDKQAAEEAIARVKDEGMQVTVLRPNEREQFKAAMQEVWAAHEDRIGSELIQKVQSALSN